ncbi:hypothetical protein OEZ85_011902 [Tetradesmus obliquus]|uniref:DNA-directed DNA polymerase n=1 Tax=Tetradesmus obliquus TaxID=3088 RepID=A0ABY8TRR1_TETOB|nr:hypothetical protein OEZ85_011902 [Tetradesmus obliquus]
MADPQLVQDSKQDSSKPADCYSLEATLQRCSLPEAAAWASLAPLARLQQQLASCISLADLLLRKLRGCVAVILAKMELVGVGIDPRHLLGHKAALKQRMAAISTRAQQLAGSPFNLASSSQLAKVLYSELGLPAPTGTGARGTAKMHLPTDEASLKQLQLATGHELPGLVLEYRSKQNAVSKYFDADWVQRAARQGAAQAAAAGGRPVVVDLRCCWNQTNTATGRLSSCSPNLQAVTKYSITAQQQQQQPDASSFSIRDVFVARPGYVLLSADYSQVELRLLAHFSGDRLLQQLLSQSGPDGDVFSLIAAAWLQQGAAGSSGCGPAGVEPALRERAKRVTYGIIYGVSAYGLAGQLQEQGIDQDKAQRLIDSFLDRFPGVQQYMAACQSSAQSAGAVRTLLHRVRPIPGLSSRQFQERQAAQRKVVNSIIQGSAADLAKLAMCAWDAWAESPAAAAAATTLATGHQGSSTTAAANALGTSTRAAAGPCARLIGQIHDELLFEVEAADACKGPGGELQQPGQTLLHVAGVVRRVMEGAAPQLDVPLPVKLSWGSRWGSMAALEV